MPRPVTLPVRREREQVELGSDIRVGRVSRVVRSHRQNSGNPESQKAKQISLRHDREGEHEEHEHGLNVTIAVTVAATQTRIGTDRP